MSVFWRFWWATAITGVGTGVSALALPLTAIYLLDATAFEVGVVTGAAFAGWAVLGLPSGVICHILPLRGVQVATDLIRATAIGSVPVAYLFDVLSLTQLVVVNLIVSLCTVLFDVSNSTFLPAVVDEDELNNRNSWISGLHSTNQVVGPPVGGVVIQVLGPAMALVIDAASYVASAIILRTLPARRQPQLEEKPQLLRMVVEGWNYVVRHPIMRACLLDATASNFVCGAFLTLTPVYLIHVLNASPAVVGLMLAAEGVGGVLGALVAGRLSDRWGTARMTLYGSIFSSILVMLVPIGSGIVALVMFGLGNVGFAAGAVVTSVNTRTYRQLASPPELLSRVMATVKFVSWGVVPLGSFLGGFAAATIGARNALIVFCVLTWLSPLVLFISPVRRMRDLNEYVDASPSRAQS